MPGGAIAVASDHAGFDLKEILKRDLQEAGLEVLDLGTNSTQSVDYPDFGMAMADAVASGKAERGVLEFDAKGDIKDAVYDIYVWKDGKSAPMKK